MGFFVRITTALMNIMIIFFLPAIAQEASVIADKNKILLDSGSELIGDVKQVGNTYYVVRYNNLLPYASGIEIFSSSGTKVTDPDKADSILNSLAWEQGAEQLKPSDIETLEEILQTTKQIHSSITPVISATDSMLSMTSWFKNDACIIVPVHGEKCAWDPLKASYPGITVLESELKSLKSDLNEFDGATTQVSNSLPSAISGLKDLQAGGEMKPQLQKNIQTSMSAFSTLKSKTNKISSSLSEISSNLSSAEHSIRSASDTRFVGDFIGTFAAYVGNLRNDVIDLKNDANSFSNTLSQQNAKLSSVSTVNSNAAEMSNSWDSRQGAATKVYGSLGAVAVIVLLIVVLVVRKKRDVSEN